LIHAAVNVKSWRASLYFGQIVGPDVQDVLPVVRPVLSTRWSPFYKEQEPLLWDVAGSFVDLEGESLNLRYSGFWSDNVKKSIIIRYKAGLVDVLIAVLDKGLHK